MKRTIVTLASLPALTAVALLMAAGEALPQDSLQPATEWKSPSKDVLEVLHAPQLPEVWTAPTGEYLLLADPVLYPPLAELAAPMHKLAGIRVNPANNGYHGRHGGTSPRLVRVEDGAVTPLDLPAYAEVHDVDGPWTASASRSPSGTPITSVCGSARLKAN